MKIVTKSKRRYHLLHALLVLIVLSAPPTHTILATDTKTYEEKQESSIPNDISFLIADIKYADNQIKILEMGEGPRSYFRGHELLYGKGLIWERLWNYLKTFKVPIWYVGRHPESEREYHLIAGQTFEQIGGTFVPNLYRLKKDPLFQQLVSKKWNGTGQYIGIIILRHHKMPRSVIAAFKKQYPQFLFLDAATSPYVNHKYKTALIFEQAGLQQFRPQWHCYPKTYSSSLVHTILHDFADVDTVVIKPVNAANGWGVLIINKDELDQTLKKILAEKDTLRKIPDKSYSWWAKDHNDNFLVEEYVPSKIITVGGKRYDGTLRMIFIIAHTDNGIDINFIGSYWKLPSYSLDEEATLTDQHKSKISSSNHSSAPVLQEDEQCVTQFLQAILPTLYATMLEKSWSTTTHKLTSPHSI